MDGDIVLGIELFQSEAERAAATSCRRCPAGMNMISEFDSPSSTVKRSKRNLCSGAAAGALVAKSKSDTAMNGTRQSDSGSQTEFFEKPTRTIRNC